MRLIDAYEENYPTYHRKLQKVCSVLNLPRSLTWLTIYTCLVQKMPTPRRPQPPAPNSPKATTGVATPPRSNTGPSWLNGVNGSLHNGLHSVGEVVGVWNKIVFADLGPSFTLVQETNDQWALQTEDKAHVVVFVFAQPTASAQPSSFQTLAQKLQQAAAAVHSNRPLFLVGSVGSKCQIYAYDSRNHTMSAMTQVVDVSRDAAQVHAQMMTIRTSVGGR